MRKKAWTTKRDAAWKNAYILPISFGFKFLLYQIKAKEVRFNLKLEYLNSDKWR